MVLGVVEGDEHALKQIYQQFCKPLTWFAYNLTGDMPQAEDIAMVALTKFWDRHTGFNTLQSIKAFLYTTARNAALDYLKSQKVRSAASASILPETIHDEDEVMARQLEAQLLKHIYDSVESLPPKARAVFKMLYLDGRNTAAIARELGMPEQTVRNNKTRALELLRIELLKRKVDLIIIFHFLVRFCS